jgi:hypothetical protein
MDTVESISEELEKCLGAINSSGLGSLDPKQIAALEKLGAASSALGMGQGKKLVDNLVTVLKSFSEGKSKEDSVQIRLTALDFYVQHLKGGAAEEEL